ncbi:MAG: hypothetical protein ABIP97_05170, partial [Chthoniobacterales bacterium]
MKSKYFLFCKEKGFSLTEVVMALGIITFSALAVMGLLPMAVQSSRQSYDQTRATQLLNSFVSGFHSLQTVSGGYTLPPPFTNASYVMALSANTNRVLTATAPFPIYLTQDMGITNQANARFVMTAFITPPWTNGYGGSVYATIAWPATAVLPTATNYWSNSI